jgi:hypothetical protein
MENFQGSPGTQGALPAPDFFTSAPHTDPRCHRSQVLAWSECGEQLPTQNAATLASTNKFDQGPAHRDVDDNINTVGIFFKLTWLSSALKQARASWIDR